MDSQWEKKRGGFPLAGDEVNLGEGVSACNPDSDSDSDDGYVVKRRRREQALLVEEDPVFPSTEKMDLEMEETQGLQTFKFQSFKLEKKNCKVWRKPITEVSTGPKNVAQPIGEVSTTPRTVAPPVDQVRKRPENVALGIRNLEKTLWEELEEKPTDSLKESFRSKLLKNRRRTEPNIPEWVEAHISGCPANVKIDDVEEDLKCCFTKLKIKETLTDEGLWKYLAELNIEDTDHDLRKRMEKLKKIAKQRHESDNLERIIFILCQIEKENSLGLSTVRSVANYFIDLKWRLSHEYNLYDLSSIAYSFAVPLFTSLFQGWDPLLKPSHKLNVVMMWKDVLQCEDSRSYYTPLVSKVLLNERRIYCLQHSWNVGNPSQMLRFLECWETLLPSSVLDNILDTIVMPKLSGNPDLWARPWLPFLGRKREDLYKKISGMLG